MQSYPRLIVLFIACAVITGAAKAQQSVTPWHYAPNNNLAGSTYPPGAVGFNLADVSAGFKTSYLPTGVKALVWLGMCNGVDSTFKNAVNAYIGDPKIYGFYLKDMPDPTGRWRPLCSAANLKAESDYIHTNLPGVKTFIVLLNFGSSLTNPTYKNTYNPANTGIDYFGVGLYPCRSDLGGSCKYSIINLAVNAAVDAGIPISQIVPVYQAFGCTSSISGCRNDSGGYYTLPSATQEQEILSTWGSLVPNPPFDYAYTWGQSNIQIPLSSSSDLKTVFASHNRLTCGTVSSP